MLWSKIAAIRSQLHYNIDFDNVWMYLVDLYTAITIILSLIYFDFYIPMCIMDLFAYFYKRFI